MNYDVICVQRAIESWKTIVLAYTAAGSNFLSVGNIYFTYMIQVLLDKIENKSNFFESKETDRFVIIEFPICNSLLEQRHK